MTMLCLDGWLQLYASGETDYHQYVLGYKVESVRLERQPESDLWTLKVYAHGREYIFNDDLIETEGVKMLEELKNEVGTLTRHLS